MHDFVRDPLFGVLVLGTCILASGFVAAWLEKRSKRRHQA